MALFIKTSGRAVFIKTWAARLSLCGIGMLALFIKTSLFIGDGSFHQNITLIRTNGDGSFHQNIFIKTSGSKIEFARYWNVACEASPIAP